MTRDLDRYLREDLGTSGDATTRALFGAAKDRTRARLWTRDRIIAAGTLEACDVFESLGAAAKPAVVEGTWVRPGTALVVVDGPLGALLAGERLALNFLGRMSGIATATRRLQDRVLAVNPHCRIAATRKTTPGFRTAEKRAIALGGGEPHRYGLYDALLIKDNHLAAFDGDIASAVKKGLRHRPALPVEVEVATATDAAKAAKAGAHWILLDNLTAASARKAAAAARKANPHVLIESSGGLTPRNVRTYAPFSDRLSLGSLTHSAKSADVTLDLVRARHA